MTTTKPTMSMTARTTGMTARSTTAPSLAEHVRARQEKLAERARLRYERAH